MKIGILGGTFNPVHLAHLRIAEEVRGQFGLDRIVFVPAGTPPHKPLAGELPFEQRFAMVELAISDNPLFAISDLEGRRGGKSYLIDTLRELRLAYPHDELFFIMGSDSFTDIGNWRDYPGFFSLCNMVVVTRPGAPILPLKNALPVAIAHEFCYYDAENRLAHQSGYSVYFTEGTLLAISSSAIRQLAEMGRSIKYLVPAAVEHYIEEQRIYAKSR
jgi:nicotinate-nucleotide adenylyltransferase